MIDFTDTQKLINNVEGFLDKEHLRSRLMGKVLQMQYFFYNKYLANKYINSFLRSRHQITLDSDPNIILKISNTYYETLYTYTNVALLDELSEIGEKLAKLDKDYDDITEEFIDAFHFITQHLILQIEHSEFLANGELHNHFNTLSYSEKYDSLNENIFKFFFNSSNINQKCKQRATNMIHLDNIPIAFNNLITSGSITSQLTDTINLTIKLQEEFNWKIWKEYPDNFYSVSKMSIMLSKTIDIFNSLFEAFCNFCLHMNKIQSNKTDVILPITHAIKIMPTSFECSIIDYVFVLMFASYYTKHKINIDRQCDKSKGYVNNNQQAAYFNIFEE